MFTILISRKLLYAILYWILWSECVILSNNNNDYNNNIKNKLILMEKKTDAKGVIRWSVVI